jgi:hypothetical protein
MARRRFSTSFCFSLCGGGVNSSLDTIWVGIGVACGSSSDGLSSAISFSVRKPMSVSQLFQPAGAGPATGAILANGNSAL